jgi:hypothetical protein
MQGNGIPPRPPGGVPAHCAACGAFFWSRTALRKKGWGRCCSKRCANTMRTPYGPRTSLHDTFWARVRVQDGCWGWSGFRDRNGYGLIHEPASHHSLFAHRVSWELRTGAQLAQPEYVLHICDTPSCTRNDDEGVYVVNGVAHLRYGHLFLGTQADNMADMVAKGRGVCGERVGSAKLTEVQVLSYRQRHASGERVTDLAQEASVAQPTMSNLLSGRTWKHLPLPTRR